MFIIFAPDLGELAYCIGDAVVLLSKELLPVGPEGEAAGLPISCAPEAYWDQNVIRLRKGSTRRRSDAAIHGKVIHIYSGYHVILIFLVIRTLHHVYLT